MNALPLFLLVAALPLAPTSGRVHDFANLLDPAAVERLETLSGAVERETTAQLAVVTVTTLDGDTIDTYAHRLFNAWGIGRRDTNNGVLLLVAPRERRMRIEVGYGLEPLLTDGLCGEIRDRHIIPRFKAGDYAGGIVAGASELARILRVHPDAARGVAGSAPAYVERPRGNALAFSLFSLVMTVGYLLYGFTMTRWRAYPTLPFLVGFVGVLGTTAGAGASTLTLPSSQQPLSLLLVAAAAALVGLAYNWRKYGRFGPHACRKCSTRLLLLDDAKEKAKLTDAQRIEEKIGAVDYDVWVCPGCLATDTERYVAWFSDFTTCPRCRHRTYREEETVILPATHTGKGLAKVFGLCASCRHTVERKRVLPMLAHSTDSSWSSSGGFGGGGGGFGGGGGGFGGGSSGGGGASGGW